MVQRVSASRSILRLVVTNWILGAVAGAFCASLLLAFDFGGVRGLMFRESATAVAGPSLLFGGLSGAFGGVVCGSGLILLRAREETSAPPPAPAPPALPALS